MEKIIHNQMKRELGLLDSTMIVAGSMIGSGIFLVSSEMARTVGSPGVILLIWLLTGVITLIAALSYGELAGMMPKAGGQYVYLKEAFNPMVGFLFGWTVFTVIQTGVIAAVAIAFAKYTAELIPFFDEQHILFSLGFFKFNATQFLALLLIAFLTILNLQGIKSAKLVQTSFTLAKLLSLVGLIVLGIYFGLNSEAFKINLTNFWTTFAIKRNDDGTITKELLSGVVLWGAIGASMIGSLFSSDSWNNITYTAGEVKDPQKNIPLSLFFGTLTVTILYILANVAYIMLLPMYGSPEGATVLERGISFASQDRVGTAAASIIFGSSAVTIMALLIMVSTFGCNNGLILSGARLYYAMAKDGVFFKRAGNLNKKDVPGFALILQAIWSSVLCLSGSYGQLLDYCTFSSLLFYIVTIIGLFVLRKKRPEWERPYKAFGYPVLPALYIIIASAICVVLLIVKPATCGWGLGIVLIGIPIYFLWNKKQEAL
ncbi:amino acid transporter [Pedobacter psychrophilus]|uniref:Amino acid transporter n=1 Tax=Pedobacter psychrophilus TaxID=1826909 RepID=A0A179DFF2_9SPHI|nr:amino acid permease [Pedobacter psychrophilus]OAQ39532.1 amino acid transporter [Pedobacter psychrophilus]